MRTESVKHKHSAVTSFPSSLDNDTYTATKTLSPAIQAVVTKHLYTSLCHKWGRWPPCLAGEQGLFISQRALKRAVLKQGIRKSCKKEIMAAEANLKQSISVLHLAELTINFRLDND